jgi:hypothetical protein
MDRFVAFSFCAGSDERLQPRERPATSHTHPHTLTHVGGRPKINCQPARPGRRRRHNRDGVGGAVAAATRPSHAEAAG